MYTEISIELVKLVHAAIQHGKEKKRYIKQFSYAIAHELRGASQLLDLAIRAEQRGESQLRDDMLSSISLPMLEAISIGLATSNLSEKDVASLKDDVNRSVRLSGEAEDGDSLDDELNNDLIKDDVEFIQWVSRVVSRTSVLKALAASHCSVEWIKWDVRLGRLKREYLSLLKAVVESK